MKDSWDYTSDAYGLAKKADGVSGFIFTKTDNPAETIRQLAHWCDWQIEDNFTPDGEMSIGDLIHLYMRVSKADVETPECLEEVSQ